MNILLNLCNNRDQTYFNAKHLPGVTGDVENLELHPRFLTSPLVPGKH